MKIRDPYHALDAFTGPFMVDDRCRGSIVDQAGKPLAMALPVFPRADDLQAVAGILADALNEHLARRASEARRAA